MFTINTANGNPALLEVSNSAGQVPRALKGVFTSRDEANKAISRFQEEVRSNPSIKKAKKAKPVESQIEE